MKLLGISFVCMASVPMHLDESPADGNDAPSGEHVSLGSDALGHWFQRISGWGRPESPKRYAITGNHRWFGEPSSEDYEAYVLNELRTRERSEVGELAVGHALRLQEEIAQGRMASRLRYNARVGRSLDFRETLDVWSEGWKITEHVGDGGEFYDMTHTYVDGVALIQRGPRGVFDHQELTRSETEHQAATGSWMAAQGMLSRLSYAIVAADAGGYSSPEITSTDSIEFSIPAFDLAGAVDGFSAILPADAYWVPCDYQVSLQEQDAGYVFTGSFVTSSSGDLLFVERATLDEEGVPLVMAQEVHDPSRGGRLLKRSRRVYREIGGAQASKVLSLIDTQYPILDSFYRGGVEFGATGGDVANQLGVAIEGSRLAVASCNAGRPGRGDFSVDWTIHPLESGAITEFTYPKSRLDVGALMIPLAGSEGATDFWCEPSCSCIRPQVLEGGDWLSIPRSGNKEVLSELSVTVGWTRDGESHQSTLLMLSAAEEEDLAGRFVSLPLRSSGETAELLLPVDSILGTGIFSTPLAELRVELAGGLAIAESELLEERDGVPRVLRVVVAPADPMQLGALSARLLLRGVDGSERGDLILSGTWVPPGVEFDAESTLRFGVEGDAVLRWSPWFSGEVSAELSPESMEGAAIERRAGAWRFSPKRGAAGTSVMNWGGAQIRFVRL